MWLAYVAAFLATLALSFCVYLWLELQRKLSAKDITSELSRSSEELNKTSERSFRALEAEWTDMYSKFMRLAGRMDKTKGIDDAKPQPVTAAEPQFLRRSDLIRKTNGRKNNVETLPT